MGALSTAFAGAVLLLAGESTSAPSPPVQADVSVEAAPKSASTAHARNCLVEVKGEVNGTAACAIEYVTSPPYDGGFSAEWTQVRIVSQTPSVLVVVSFYSDPQVGSQSVALDAATGRTCYASVKVERNGQHWEALSHAEPTFSVVVSSARATCNDGGLKCWEIHGRVQASVPSALLSPFASPLAVSAIF